MRYLPLLLAFVLLAVGPSGPADAQPGGRPARQDGRDPMDEAIARGLRFLAGSQSQDGSWSTGGFGGPGRGGGGDMAVSALSVMAFLAAGHVPNEGPYGDVVAQGAKYVASQLNPITGLIAPTGGLEMYYHGICTLMLAEVIGLTDGRTAEDFRRKLEAAVQVILKAQKRGGGNEDGGWRYQVQSFDSDLSVAGWQLMALRAAKNVGCDVPQDRIDAAVKYVRRCHDIRTGAFKYTVNGPTTVPCTGVGILCLELSGKELHLCDECLRAGSYLLKNPLQPGSAHFFYGVYYTSQAMFQLGDNYWKTYREKLHDMLLRANGPQTDGSWSGRGHDDRQFGPCYCTAMAILALACEYRFLPIYQRFEEPQERD